MAKILIIDDDEAVREYLATLVTRLHHQAYKAATCAEGMALLADPTMQVVIADIYLPEIARTLAAKGVEMRCCAESLALLREAGIAGAKLVEATAADWREEYLAPIIAVKIVAGLDEAIEHINTCSSGHTEAIVTENYSHAMRFLREVDSSSVMVNASTRFADGFEYGLGAEIGISTDKIHARGPVGLEGLTSQKWIVFGNGEVRR